MRRSATIAKFQYWNEAKLKNGPWDSDGRREIYKSAQLDSAGISQLQKLCLSHEIDFLISCFNVEDATFLKKLGINRIKIPSHEIANISLHEYSSKNFSKCYVSLGAGSMSEIEQAASIYNSNNSDWVGMHCVSSYPCPIDKINLKKLDVIGEFSSVLGFSDHTNEYQTPALAVAYGVEVVEKHFTSDNDLPGRDNKFALNPVEFKKMVDLIRLAETANIFRGDDAMDIELDTIKNYRGRWG